LSKKTLADDLLELNERYGIEIFNIVNNMLKFDPRERPNA